MKYGKEIILYGIIFILVVIVIFGFLKCRNTSGSLEQAFVDLQSSKNSIAAAERELDKTGETIKELRNQLASERENYSKLEKYSGEFEAEHIRQREIYREFGITTRSNQEAVNTISKLVEQSRVILEELLTECKAAKN